MGYLGFMATKSIEISPLNDPETTKFNPNQVTKFAKKVRKQMLLDRDYLIKGSKAYVSFIRSYIEHKLSSIFKVNSLDLADTAKSFFLFKMPFIKELKDVEGSKAVIATDEELSRLETVPFRNKNQEKMIKAKIEQDRSKKLKSIQKRKKTREKAQKEQKRKKVRSFAERNRAKKRNEENELKDLRREKKLEDELRKGKITKEEYEKQMEGIYRKYEYGVKTN